MPTFIVLFIGATTVFQLKDEIPPWVDRSSIDMMNGSMIWMVSALCLVMVHLRREEPLKMLMWIGGCAALGLMALDELFILHEKASGQLDDDYSKIIPYLAAGVALTVLIKVENITGRIRTWLIAGYVLHTLYLLSDLGDGDFFSVPALTLEELDWVEEYLEISAMCTYFGGFLKVVLSNVRPATSADHKDLA